MPAQQQHWIRSAYLSGSTGAVAVGTALVSNGSSYVVATSANRTSYGRSEGIAITAGDDDDPAVEIQCAGVAPNSITGLGAGTATWVIVSSTGTLERDDTPDSGEDVIGKCNARGDLFLAPGVWDNTNTSPGGGAGTPGGSDTQVQFNDAGAFGGDSGLTFNKTTNALTVGGALAAAALTLTAALTVANGGTGAATFTAGDILLGNGASALSSFTPGAGVQTFLTTPSSANLRAAVTDETGSGSLVFATSPTLTTPNIGAATGTSLTTTGDITTSGGQLINSNSASGRKVSIQTSAGARAGFAVDGSTLVVGQDDTGAGSSGRVDALHLRGDVIELYASSGGIGTGRLKLDVNGIYIRENAAGVGTHWLQLVVPDLAADRTINFPAITGTDTLAALGLAQTFTATQTFVAPVLGAATATSVAASSFVSIGATPATSGGVRLSVNSFVRSRDNGNTANQDVVGLNTSDQVVVGSTTNLGAVRLLSPTGQYVAALCDTFYVQTPAAATSATITSSGMTLTGTSLAIGTNPATTAHLRVPNNVTALAARNAANDANLDLVATDGSNNVVFGGANSVAHYYKATTHYLNTAAGGLIATATSSALSLAVPLETGGTPATIGQVRLTGATSTDLLAFRYSGADYNLARLNGSATLMLGTTGFPMQIDCYNILLNANTGDITVFAGGAQVGTVGSAGWQFGAGAKDFGGGVGVIGIDNAGTNPSTNPTSGGVLYVDAGALKYRGSGGTVTTIANA